MNDLKLLGRNENDLENEMKIVQTISKDMNIVWWQFIDRILCGGSSSIEYCVVAVHR